MRKTVLHRSDWFPVRLMGTLSCVILYRLLAAFPVPFSVNGAIAADLFGGHSSDMLNLLTGGSLVRVSWAALGISPYISASIFIQFLSAVVPSLAALQKAGLVGQKKIHRMTLVLSAFLAVPSSIGLFYSYSRAGYLSRTDMLAGVVIVAVLVGTAVLLALMGLCISEYFFGDGISILLLTGIAGSMPNSIMMASDTLTWQYGPYVAALFLAGCLLLFGFIVWLFGCERRIGISYSAKMVDGHAAEDDVLCLRLLSNNVMPIVFASSFLAWPAIAASFFGRVPAWFVIFDTNAWFQSDRPLASIGAVVYVLLIFFFSRLNQMMSLNETELAEEMKRMNCVVNGILPGKDTEKFLKKQMVSLNRLSSVCLCVVALLPILVGQIFHIPGISGLGTSLMLVVSVIWDAYYVFVVERCGYRYSNVLSRLRRDQDLGLLKDKR